MSEDRTAREGWKKLLPRDPWQVLIGPVLVLLIGAGVTLLISSKGKSKSVALQALPPVVDNPVARQHVFVLKSGPFKGYTASHQTDSSKARIEIRLHNLGAQRSVLTAARFTVRRLAIIRPCGQGAPLAVSTRYDLRLPQREGATVTLPIDEQLGPDQADRFVFRVISKRYRQRHTADVLVYELGIAVLHDDSPKPLRVGEVVLAVPGAPTSNEPEANYFGVPGHADCVKHAPADQRIAATFSGVKSPQLASYLRFLRTA